jgi:Ca-activated chloride channel family protein
MRRIILLAWFILVSDGLLATGIIKNAGDNNTYLRPDTISVRVRIDNQVAVTTIRETYTNTTGGRILMNYGYPLSARQSVTGFLYTMNDTTKAGLLTGQAPDTAATGPGGAIDYYLAHYLGDTPFYFPFSDSLAADSVLTVEMTLIELLQYGSGEIYYWYPLDAKGFESRPIESFDVRIELHSQRSLESVEAAGITGAVVDFGPNNAEVGFQQSPIEPDRDFVLKYTVSQKDLGVSLMSMKPGNEEGYFILIAEPDPGTLSSPRTSSSFWMFRGAWAE